MKLEHSPPPSFGPHVNRFTIPWNTGRPSPLLVVHLNVLLNRVRNQNRSCRCNSRVTLFGYACLCHPTTNQPHSVSPVCTLNSTNQPTCWLSNCGARKCKFNCQYKWPPVVEEGESRSRSERERRCADNWSITSKAIILRRRLIGLPIRTWINEIIYNCASILCVGGRMAGTVTQ